MCGHSKLDFQFHPNDLARQVEGLRLEGLVARIRQHLGGEVRCSYRGDPNGFEVLANRFDGGNGLQRQLGAAQDSRQQVIEFVGDPTGEQSEALQLLRFAQLGIQSPSLVFYLSAPRDFARERRVGTEYEEQECGHENRNRESDDQCDDWRPAPQLCGYSRSGRKLHAPLAPAVLERFDMFEEEGCLRFHAHFACQRTLV